MTENLTGGNWFNYVHSLEANTDEAGAQLVLSLLSPEPQLKGWSTPVKLDLTS